MLAALAVALCCGVQDADAASADGAGAGRTPDPLRVMSFNIRRGLLDDGPRRWRHRRALVVGAIRDRQPHVLGLQEALPHQRRDLRKALRQYDVAGLSAKGLRLGEITPILVDRRRIAVERHGHFWLNESGKPLAKGWDAMFPRVCAWAVLRDRRTGARFVFFNTHLDNKGEKACEEGARLVIRRRRRFADLPALLTGDLNSRERTRPLELLRGDGFRDTFRAVHPDAEDVRTSHRFEGLREGDKKIDYVLFSGRWRVRAADIHRYHRDGRYPSDHFPVWADLELAAAQGAGSRPAGAGAASDGGRRRR